MEKWESLDSKQFSDDNYESETHKMKITEGTIYKETIISKKLHMDAPSACSVHMIFVPSKD